MMRLSSPAALLLSAFLLPTLFLPALASAEEGPFLRDARAAFAEAGETHRPLLIDFRTTWCVACREMDKTTWKDREVLDRLARFVALEVDGDRDANLTARYGVEAYPTIVFAAPDGVPILALLGLQGASAMKAHLDDVAADLERLSAWAHEAEKRRPDPEALVDLAEFASRHGASGQAEDLYRQALRRSRKRGGPVADRARAGLAALLAREGECREARKLAEEIDRSVAASGDATALDALIDGCE